MTTPRKRFAHTSNTWQLFQKYFFLDGDRYPYTLPPMPRGNAINLVQGLNCCNVQWADEQSMPHIFLTLSAKAKKGENDLWTVEISTNYRKQGIASPSKESRKSTDWMAKLLAVDTGANDTASSSSNYDTTSSPSGEGEVYVPSPVSQQAPEPEISHMENALEGWLGAGRTPANTDDPNAASGRYPLNTEGEE